MSKIATKMALSLCKVSVTDPMSGFFAIGRKTFEQALPHLNPKGFKILLDLLIHVPADTVVKELPFTFSIRLYGESKLSRRVQIEFLEYLYEATIGHTIPLTLLQYCVVGTIGVIVNLGFYVIAADILSRVGVGLSVPAVADFSVAVLVGVEAAIVFNFLLNNLWTFAQARLKGMNAFVGFLKFNAACLFGAFANYAVTVLLVSRGFSVIESVAAGGVLGMIWNYTISRLFTWHV
jgi:dolichol-phosphate mannosyltransferase